MIGIDVGGTFIKSGLVVVKDGNALVERFSSIPTPKSKVGIEDAIVELTKKLQSGEGASGIGIGFPSGLSDGIIGAPNLVGFNGVSVNSLASELEKRTGLPVKIENDAKCVLLAEKLFGEGKKTKKFVVLTLGTGIGGAAQIGEESVGMLPGFILIGETNEDYLENRFSVRALMAEAKRKGLVAKDVKELALLEEKGNPVAKQILLKSAKHLAHAVQIMYHVFQPEKVVLTGGMSHWENLIEDARKELQGLTTLVPRKNMKIEVSALEHGGVIGAASLFL